MEIPYFPPKINKMKQSTQTETDREREAYTEMAVKRREDRNRVDVLLMIGCSCCRQASVIIKIQQKHTESNNEDDDTCEYYWLVKMLLVKCSFDFLCIFRSDQLCH